MCLLALSVVASEAKPYPALPSGQVDQGFDQTTALQIEKTLPTCGVGFSISLYSQNASSSKRFALQGLSWNRFFMVPQLDILAEGVSIHHTQFPG